MPRHWLAIAALLAMTATAPALAQSSATNTPKPTMPADIDPESGFRLPLPKREDLDEAGKRAYDRLTDPKGGTLAGLRDGDGATQPSFFDDLRWDDPSRCYRLAETRHHFRISKLRSVSLRKYR